MSRHSFSKQRKRAIGERLRNLRLHRQLTLSGLSTKAGVGIGTISEIETKDDRVPSMTTLDRLARALGVSISELIGAD